MKNLSVEERREYQKYITKKLKKKKYILQVKVDLNTKTQLEREMEIMDIKYISEYLRLIIDNRK